LLFPARKTEHSAVLASRRLLLLVAGWTLLAARSATADLGGWDYVVERLVGDGLDRTRVTHAFTDPRMEPFTGLDFSIDPRESHALYQDFLRGSSVAAARRCRDENATVLRTAAEQTGVSADLVAAILFIETRCGQNTGSSRVLYRLARLAMANEPANLRANIARLAGDVIPDAEIESRVRARAQYLEDTFYPEVRATFEVADRMRVDPLDLRGSPSGAVGYPQFLPTSYLRYGTDAGGDGHIDLFDTADAASSCATYLAAKGWRDGLSIEDRRAVIWHYNRSAAYVDAVLTLARRLETGEVVQEAAVRPRPRKQVARNTRTPKRGTKTVARGGAKTSRRAPRGGVVTRPAPATVAQGSAG
jgi:membrane-bound lytic murein transglycosylase B